MRALTEAVGVGAHAGVKEEVVDCWFGRSGGENAPTLQVEG